MDPSPRTFRFLPLSIHLETVGGLATPLVLRGTPLPTQRSQTFATASDNQESVEIKLVMGESGLASKDISLGTVRLPGLPPGPRGAREIEISFGVDTTCAVSVIATVKGTSIRVEERLSNALDMSDETIARILAETETSKQGDDRAVQLIEATNRANAAIARAERKLQSAANDQFSGAVATLGLAIQSGNGDDIRTKTEALEQLLATQDALAMDLFSGFGDIFGTQRPRPGVSKPIARAASKSPVTKQQPSAKASVSVPAVGSTVGHIFGGGQFTLDPTLCFVLMPFAEKFRAAYDDHIRPTVEATGLRCQRADDLAGTNRITWDIWERINRARFLIAELTDQNANVFYELGLAHAIGKDVVLMTQSMEFVPFDLKSLRCIVYGFTPRGMRELEAKLRTTIATLMMSGAPTAP